MASTVRIPGLVITEHELEVPLDHDAPDGPRLTIFAREVAEPEGTSKPLLLFLQGGPGFEAPRPTDRGAPPFLERALQDFRVLLLDQRGTGRSTPVGALPGLSPAQQADHLRHFRADAIVRDCEALRAALDSPPWTVLGQSFGGLTLTTYLSFAPEGLEAALFTGGLPPVGRGPDDVYAHTWPRTVERNRRYLERYPADRARLRALRDRLERESLRLPTGDRLTWRRFAQVGDLLGMSTGAEDVHHIVELSPDSPAFGHDVVAATPFERHPIYAILHEACWADGGATRWSAERLRPDDPDLLTGEHVFPWMFEDYGGLAPLGEAAHLLAEHEWPRLYDEAALRANEVPCAAAVYYEDMYVERVWSEETAAMIRGLRPWITNEYEHNGLRADGPRILDRLLALARGACV